MLPVSTLLSAAVLQVIMFLSTDAEQLLGIIIIIINQALI